MDLPPHITIHTWPTATLTELTHLLASHSPHILPGPSIGTRLAYRLLYHDTRGTSGATASPSAASAGAPRLASQDLGSVVIGDGGPGIAVPNKDDDGGDVLMDGTAAREESSLDELSAATAAAAPVGSEAEARKTLADARFVAGDFLSVAILPPSAVDGSVQPASAARMGRGHGIGQATVGVSGLAPSMDAPGRERGDRFGRGRALGPRLGSGNGASIGSGGAGSGIYGREGPSAAVPMGEWRRGQRLPDMPPPPSRGRGRRRW